MNMMTIKNQNLALTIDEKDGFIKSVKGQLPGHKEIEFCDSRPLRSFAPHFWGETRIANGFKCYYASQGSVDVSTSANTVTSSYKFADFDLGVTREICADYLEETYSLSSNSACDLIDFALFFRPNLTMHVGEHKPYYFVDNTPVVYHWFTGNNLAYLVLSHNQGTPPHLGVVLVKGRLCGFSTPYSSFPMYYNPQEGEPNSAIPILHVTAWAQHKEADEYPQPRIYLGPGEKEEVVLRYFLFSNWRDFQDKSRLLCQQPTFDYPHFVPKGARLEIEATLPDNVPSIKASVSGRQLAVTEKSKGRYLITDSVRQAGLQKIDIEYGDRKTFLLFEGMNDLREIIRDRTEYILDKQFVSDPQDERWGGIFPIDNLTEEIISSPWVVWCQVAATGEQLSSATLVAYKNLADPDPEEIHKIEITAAEWIRKKCQDKEFACYVNPLNKLQFADSEWTYTADKINIYKNPDNPKEFGWRRWNAPYNAAVYYLLSLFDNSLLEREDSDTYLLWAYGTMNWYLSTKPPQANAESYFIPKIVKELQKRDYLDEAKQLQNGWDKCVTRFREDACELKDREWTMDQNAFVSSATPLLIEGDLESARPYLTVNDTDLGYSYDPRLQSGFRIWDDGATEGYYRLVPHHTMPHFWTAEVAYPLVLSYELTGNEEHLIIAYNAMLTVYEFYNYDYKWNKWGSLKKGQAHVNYLPSLDMATQERHCIDQDAGLVPYLETFGKKCYVTKNGKFINCQNQEGRVISWAAYPREYLFDDEGVSISSDHFSVVINYIERQTGRYCLQAENLSKMPVTATITFKCRTGGEEKGKLELKAKGKETITLC